MQHRTSGAPSISPGALVLVLKLNNSSSNQAQGRTSYRDIRICATCPPLFFWWMSWHASEITERTAVSADNRKISFVFPDLKFLEIFVSLVFQREDLGMSR